MTNRQDLANQITPFYKEKNSIQNSQENHNNNLNFLSEKQELIIDDEFKTLVPALKDYEYKELETSILTEGVRDKLVIWSNVLLDGHNRYEIAQKHNKEFETHEMTFKSRDEAKAWIICNQLARRNLNDWQRGVLGEKLRPIIEKKAKEKQLSKLKKGKSSVYQNSGKREEKCHTNKEISKATGLSQDTVSRIKKIIQKGTEDQMKKLVKGARSINSVYKDIMRIDKKNNIKDIPLEELKGKFNVLLADPSWQYDRRDSNIRGVADDHYPTMTFEEIKELPVGDKALDNSVLFLWTTLVMIEKAFDVIKAWGFTFKSSMVWVKDRIGTGFYVRSKHEIILIGTKGSFLPMTTDLPESTIFAKREKHSKKPEILYEIIEKMYPEQKYLELFAREKRKNWESWGNEI